MSSEVDQIGGNAKAVLNGFVDRLFDLYAEENACKEQIKARKAVLKDEGHPVAELVRLAKLQPTELAEKSEKEAVARRLLGLPGIEETDEEVEADASVMQEIEAIMGLEEEKANCVADRKEVLKEVKSAGFVPKIVDQVVQFKFDPEKQTKWSETNHLLEVYLDAVG